MSAICGLWRIDRRPGAADDVSRMRRALAPYGVDRDAAWDGDEIALGARLTARLPEDRHDRQPMRGAGGRYAMVADLRIDNRAELAESLGIEPQRAAVMADGQFAVAAWERWGVDAIDRLVGDFAIAVWDGHERILHLARDPSGFRPLFFHRAPGRIAFATMARGLHALDDVAVAVDADSVARFLAVAPLPAGRGFFAGIERVGQGEHVAIRADGSVVRRNWYGWGAGRETRFARPDDYADTMRDLFDRAVRDRLRATGPVASHLSGGLDSGAVTASAAIQAAPEAILAYTHVPMRGVPVDRRADRVSDEGPAAAMLAARHDNIRHRLIDAAGHGIGEDLDTHFATHESPVLDIANLVWVNAINRAAHDDGARVLLGGYMGNLTISNAGEAVLHGLLRRLDLSAWAREARAMMRTGELTARGVAYRSLAPFLPPAVLAAMRRAIGRYQPGMADYSALNATPELLAALARDGHATDPAPARDRRAAIRRVLTAHDMMGTMAKGDLARFGIEPRDPTSDRRLLDFCLSIPDGMFARAGQPCWIFHRAFADRLPPETLARRSKGLQGADWAHRMASAGPGIADEIARAAASPTASALIDLDDLREQAGNVPDPAAVTPETALRYRIRLLRGASVAHFLRKIEGGNA